MKTNKWGIRVSLAISILSLLGAIFLKDWWQNLSFAILFSRVMLLSVPLIILAVIFGIGHITISLKNRN